MPYKELTVNILCSIPLKPRKGRIQLKKGGVNRELIQIISIMLDAFFFLWFMIRITNRQLTNTGMGVERKQGDDLKHLGTVAGERKKSYYH